MVARIWDGCGDCVQRSMKQLFGMMEIFFIFICGNYVAIDL